MAKKKKNIREEVPVEPIEEKLSKTEEYIERNQKMLTNVVIVVIILIVGFFLIKRYYIGGRESEAQSQIWAAESYFEKDSLDLALYGDGNHLGFVDITREYRWTRTARLARYYKGLIYLKQGQYELALENLKKYKGRDKMVRTMATGAIGDAYMELGQIERAIGQYERAASRHPNDLTSPLFYLKAAWAYEELGDYKAAIEMYEKIKRNHPESNEGREADKYIAKAKVRKAK